MPDNAQTPKKSITPDWLVQGALTRIGDMLDKLTGRSWKPASSLATSGLIERLKGLLDSHIKRDADGRSYVPHNIKLKMQWDKFSTDSEDSLRKVENELLTAAVDHISDNRYYTYAPLKLEAKPDYFTEGVKLFVSFEQFDEEGGEGELNVTIPATNLSHLIPGSLAGLDGVAPASGDGLPKVLRGDLVVNFNAGPGGIEKRFNIEQGKRLSVGRTKDNDITIDHTSVSKMHASLLLNAEGKLVVADTGSTNGTFLNGERITYGKAIEIFAGDKIKFGAIDVRAEFTPEAEAEVSPDAATEAYTVGDFQFSKKTEVVAPAVGTEVPRAPAETHDKE
ncbi:MAG TPA: FHA domain-containing protein [Pyrinomonadaceae bacterium]|nr:FHA domain-containing protein [Pyrinomonadaceae bacterium]